MDIEQILVCLGLYDKSLTKLTVFNFMDIEQILVFLDFMTKSEQS